MRTLVRTRLNRLAVIIPIWLLILAAQGGELRAADGPATEPSWVVATVDGSTYRAIMVETVPGVGTRVVTRNGMDLTIPTAKVARVWRDRDTASLPPALIVRDTCRRSQLRKAPVRELGIGAEKPFRAALVEITPGKAILFRRSGATADETGAWSDVEFIRLPPGESDQCLESVRAAGQDEDSEIPGQGVVRKPGGDGRTFTLVGAGLLPGGLLIGSVALALTMTRKGVSCTNSDVAGCLTSTFGDFGLAALGYTVAGFGGVIAVTGLAFLIHGGVSSTNPAPQTPKSPVALWLAPYFTSTAVGLVGGLRL